MSEMVESEESGEKLQDAVPPPPHEWQTPSAALTSTQEHQVPVIVHPSPHEHQTSFIASPTEEERRSLITANIHQTEEQGTDGSEGNSPTDIGEASHLDSDSDLSDSGSSVSQSPLPSSVPRKKVLLLFHPEVGNSLFVGKLLAFCKEIKSTHVDIVCGIQPGENWREFAETALKHFHDVIFIVSDKMNKVCAGNTNRDLLMERNGENIPLIVLDKLRQLVQDDQQNSHHFVFITSLEECTVEGNRTLQEFLNKHNFFTRTVNTKTYNLHGKTLSSPECQRQIIDFFTVLSR